MDEAYWDHIFASFRKALDECGAPLPAVSLMAIETDHDPWAVLASTIVSLRTKDQVTLDGSRRLVKLCPTPEAAAEAEEEDIAKAIYPSGFYKRKAVQIKAMGREIVERFGGKVPSTAEELMSLPGVGIKTANLTLNLGFATDAICVDCHVHQISNRLGWISTKTPEESVAALGKVMPRKWWIDLNELLVTYGQHICLPISPWCSKCPEGARCPKVGVARSR